MRPALLACLFLLSGALLVFAATPASYTTQCSPCHGADGKGKTISQSKFEVPDLHSKKVQDLTDEELYEGIAHGTKHKEYPHGFLYRGLKEKDVADLVKYIRTLAPPKK